MRRLEFICDGCSLTKHVELPSGAKPNFMLEGWVAHQVVAHENGESAYEISADLCPECTEKFRHAINPANWPRMDATVRQFAKK
jgi:hypothetical protein